jgi:hypothetical protein
VAAGTPQQICAAKASKLRLTSRVGSQSDLLAPTIAEVCILSNPSIPEVINGRA